MAAKLTYRVPTEDDIRHIAKNMRASDVAEIIASGSKSPYASLKRGMKDSKACVVACFNDEPLAIYGMTPPTPLTGLAAVWLLGTDESLKFPREFMTESREVLKEMLTEASTLYNYVHSRNTVSVKWLTRLGFKMEEPQVMGPYNELFQKFTMERS